MGRFCFVFFLILVVALALAANHSFAADFKHPLDPLSAVEITKATSILKSSPKFPKAALFSTVQLLEPPKAVVLNFRPGAPIQRTAFAIIFDRLKNLTIEAAVDLNAGKIVSWKYIPGAQPLVFMGEYDVLEELVKADPRWRAAMGKRGITDFEDVAVDGWAVGEISGNLKGRLLRGLSYHKKGTSNYYGKPIEGVVAVVNMNDHKVIEVTDSGVVPISASNPDLNESSVGPLQEKLKPLLITQPEGVSYRIEGNAIYWGNWQFRYSMHPREGLVLHTVGYRDGTKVRSILYRASLAEMVVPYGDPDGNWRWRAAFDVGEYGVGRLASPLEPNLDAPPNAQLIDVAFAGDDGEPEPLERAVAIYERDGGILWKHFDSVNGKNESRRARDLVMSFVATIGNYDYAVNYIFKQDGSIEIDLALTGIMLAKGVKDTVAGEGEHDHSSGSTSHLVAENIAAPHHQHFFNFRLDFDVDGTKNSVGEMGTFRMPAGPSNPYLNGFIMSEAPLKTELAARRMLDIQSHRVWTISSNERNALRQRTSFILVPGANSIPYADPNSQIRRRAQFINHHFWATNFNEAELYPAGVYPNQSNGGDGLPKYAADDQPIQDQDVVVWYTLGVTHVPRPEEWPVMPTTHAGFKLLPGGFFAKNPALNVPR